MTPELVDGPARRGEMDDDRRQRGSRQRLLTGRSHATQPALGLLGLLLVVPIAGLLALGAGARGIDVVLGPLVTFSLPLVVMVAFWCADWPGSRLRASWSGWGDTALIAAGAVVLAGIGQTMAGQLDVVGLFDPTPGPGHVPTFPATLPLAGTAFVMVSQLTLVGEGWPLRNLPTPRRAARGRDLVDHRARPLLHPGRDGPSRTARACSLTAAGRCPGRNWVRRWS